MTCHLAWRNLTWLMPDHIGSTVVVSILENIVKNHNAAVVKAKKKS
jgi:hypothetical protein